MANTLTNAYIKTFESVVRFLAQQKGSKLMPYCQKRSGNLGESHSWSRVGIIEAITKAGRAVDTPIQNTPFSTRIASPATKHAGDLVEPEDIVQMLINPTSAINTALGYAMGRAYDDQIIAAATGTALDSGGNANALPATQNATPGTSGGPVPTGTPGNLTLSSIASINSVFLNNNIDPETPKIAVVGPGQVQQLIQIDKATSEFFVKAKALEEHGYVTNWMGYNWICSTRLTVPTAGQTSCLFFSDQAMGYMSDKDIWAEVTQRADKSYAWQVYTAFTGGSVRVEDEHMVRCDMLSAFV